MKENLEPKNDKGQRHGVCEYYWANGQLCYKYVFINGKKNGFAECMVVEKLHIKGITYE